MCSQVSKSTAMEATKVMEAIKARAKERGPMAISPHPTPTCSIKGRTGESQRSLGAVRRSVRLLCDYRRNANDAIAKELKEVRALLAKPK